MSAARRALLLTIFMFMGSLMSGRVVGAIPASATECVDPHAAPAPVVANFGPPADPQPTTFTALPDGTIEARDVDTNRVEWIYTPPASTVLPLAAGPLGPISVLRFDANADGIIDADQGDRLWIFFGMGNRGRAWFALDATSRRRASVLWIDSGDKLPHLGLTWGKPTIARVRISDAVQNGEQLVVFLPGGAAPPLAVPTIPGTEGARVYAVDAATGVLLWTAGAQYADDTPDLTLDKMTFGLASRVSAVDLDADGLTDRLYASDIGAQLWRFDLSNNQARSSFATGARLASLGFAESAIPSGRDSREFFNAPDVSLIASSDSSPYFALILGSGNALSIDASGVQDRLYSIRDTNPFKHMTATDAAELVPIIDDDLPLIATDQEILSVPALAHGWKRNLLPSEKILAEGTTSNGLTMIPAFTPRTGVHPCGEGTNRVYVLRADNGKAALDLNDDHVVDSQDISFRLDQTTVAPEVRIVQTLHSGPSSASTTKLDAVGRETRCLSGTETLSHCAAPHAVVRTYWRRESAR